MWKTYELQKIFSVNFVKKYLYNIYKLIFLLSIKKKLKKKWRKKSAHAKLAPEKSVKIMLCSPPIIALCIKIVKRIIKKEEEVLREVEEDAVRRAEICRPLNIDALAQIKMEQIAKNGQLWDQCIAMYTQIARK
jgi:hypothetical protein